MTLPAPSTSPQRNLQIAVPRALRNIDDDVRILAMHGKYDTVAPSYELSSSPR